MLKISQALLDLASVADAVLFSTSMAQAALKDGKLESTQQSLLERIDGFRSMEQVLAMSGDLIGVHSALGKLMVSGYVTLTPHAVAVIAAAASAEVKPAATVASAVTVAPGDLENAKRLLLLEAKLVFGKGAATLRPRVEACRSIEEIYDLIVKVRQHLTTTGKANPDVFLDRLTNGLATARKKSLAGQRAAVQ